MQNFLEQNKRIICIAIGLKILGSISLVFGTLAGSGLTFTYVFGFTFLAPAIAACFAEDKRFLLGFIIVGSGLLLDLILLLILAPLSSQPEESGMAVVFGAVLLLVAAFAGLVGTVVGGVLGIIKEKIK